MSNYLNKFTAPLVALGWLGFGIILITILGFMSLMSTLFNGFRDSVWMYGIPATVAIFLYPMILIIGGMVFYYTIRTVWLLFEAGYWGLRIKLTDNLNGGVIEGEFVD